ncbi:MAG: hypothetical protein K2I10_11455 [Lachnospiraceae bacterium]|nr:hypothetical protein [Lachnospiraceae bacterium]
MAVALKEDYQRALEQQKKGQNKMNKGNMAICNDKQIAIFLWKNKRFYSNI